MGKPKLLLASFSQKSGLAKSIVSLVSLLIFLGTFGCGGTGIRVVDTVPLGEPGGFVRIYIKAKDEQTNFPGFPDIYSNGVSQGSWPITNPKWRHNDRSIMISRTPGIHPFTIQSTEYYKGMQVRAARQDIQVRIEERKITPVRISFTLTEEEIRVSGNISRSTFYLTMHVTVEETVPITE